MVNLQETYCYAKSCTNFAHECVVWDYFDPLQLYKMLENIEPFLFLISDFFLGALSNTGAKLSLTLL